ncbi:hypothetical protein [Turneriella parva]|uniref:Uncharacterized protein n=1 Tax=Turneriella parva (strain ATCC BAA-1111 / DSM 21527 / NCTC 11395 / H) TaxID=869212 RepID=I4B826_TURPD|nr:hypothetical protein [Turneriella parva]AFM13433.1 hypothetical protein Turpa_2794 [Turneriella parva DSM 21527]
MKAIMYAFCLSAVMPVMIRAEPRYCQIAAENIISAINRKDVVQLAEMFSERIYILESEYDHPEDFNFSRNEQQETFRRKKGKLYEVFFAPNAAKKYGFNFRSIHQSIQNQQTVTFFCKPTEQHGLENYAVSAYGAHIFEKDGAQLSLFLDCRQESCRLKSFYYIPSLSAP